MDLLLSLIAVGVLLPRAWLCRLVGAESCVEKHLQNYCVFTRSQALCKELYMNYLIESSKQSWSECCYYFHSTDKETEAQRHFHKVLQWVSARFKLRKFGSNICGSDLLSCPPKWRYPKGRSYAARSLLYPQQSVCHILKKVLNEWKKQFNESLATNKQHKQIVW